MRRKQVQEEREGGYHAVSDLYFDRIGKPIPILPGHHFLSNSLPSQPLAVSQPHRLLFLAHSSGFLVARTKDVMDAAAKLEAHSGTSVRDVCLMDVSMSTSDASGVRILSLSPDSSTLAAASFSHLIHFFSIPSLLHKEQAPSFSCSLQPSSTIKDLQWRSNSSFLVLSHQGKLQHGILHAPLKDVSGSVDAFEGSPKGNYVALARKSNISILSSDFEEKLSISLPLKPWNDNSDGSCIVRVDSIRWVRQDSLIVGCFQQTADSEEESYLLQVVRSKNGKIIDVDSELVVLSFHDLFFDIVDDIVPSGSGPYLLLAYLKQCQLAIAAHRKKIDQHIVCLGWLENGEGIEVAVVEIERDSSVPRIELQGNGDDNLVLGLCIDEVSCYGKVKVEIELEEIKELSPYCVLMCVTLEGKLAMFNVASAEGEDRHDSIHGEEEDSLDELPAGNEQPVIPVEFAKQASKQTDPWLEDKNNRDHKIDGVMTEDLKSSMNRTSARVGVENKSHADNVGLNWEVQSVLKNQSSPTDRLLQFPPKLYQNSSQQMSLSGQQSGLGQSFFKSSLLAGSARMNDSGLEVKDFSSYSPGQISFPEKAPPAASSLSNSQEMPESIEATKELSDRIESSTIYAAPNCSGSTRVFLFSHSSPSQSLSPSSSLSQANILNDVMVSIDKANAPTDLGGRQLKVKDTSIGSSSFNFPVGPMQRGGLNSFFIEGTIESLPSIRSQPLSLQDDFAHGSNVSYAFKNSRKSPSVSSPEPNFSRQFGSIKVMTKELDMLLQGIEEPGGFRDACTTLQSSSIDELEKGMRTLLKRCTTLKTMIDGRQNEIQLLLDETVQVLAKKLYLEGIIKQYSDIQYWELWDQQRLSSEFEMKRQRILQLNQDMTNQVIELEKHFNSIEFQKFGEQDGGHMGGRSIQSQRQPAKSLQPLLCLHSTMSSQLAAAEQISERLSKQMALLSVESPAKQKSARKELFEMIGIPLDTSFSSPDATKVASSKNIWLSSGSDAIKYQSRRFQRNATKCSDSETARRRRESLDQSWANFEPIKTTVKRMLLQDKEGSPNKSSLLLGAEYASGKQVFDDKNLQFGSPRHAPQTVQGTGLTSPFSTFIGSHPMNQNLAEENLGMIADKSSILIQKSPQQSGARLTQRTSIEQSRLNSSFLQSNISPVAESLESHLVERYFNVEAKKVSAEKSSFSFQKPLGQAETTLPQKLATPTISPLSFANEASELQKTDTVSAFTPITSGNVKPEPVLAKMSAVGSTSLTVSPSFLSSNSVALDQSSKLLQFEIANNKEQPGDKASSSPSVSLPVSPASILPSGSVSSSAAPTLPAALPSGKSAPMGHFSQAASTTTLSSSSLLLRSQFTSTKTQVIPSAAHPPATTSNSRQLETQPVTAKTSSLTSSIVLEYPKADLTHPGGQSSPSAVSTLSPMSVSSKIASATFGPPSVNLSSFKSESANTEVQPPTSGINPIATTAAPFPQPQLSAFCLKLEPVASSSPTVAPTAFKSASQVSLDSSATSESHLAPSLPVEATPAARLLAGTSPPPPTSSGGKPENLDDADGGEDEMEEEATETAQGTELSLGSLGGFGIGSTSAPAAPAANPFGTPYSNVASNQASSPFTMTVPSGELFRPASFSFSSPMPSVPSPATSGAVFSGGFGAGNVGQAPAQSAFGQPAHVGAGQQALGSVLGAFGQSRQIGGALSGSGFGSPGVFGGGFGNASSTSGFSSSVSDGGFSGASAAGGFAAMASGGRGFVGVATGGGGFTASGGFAAAATTGGGFGGASSAAGGGFGAFSNQQGTSGFGGFGGNPGGSQQGTGGFSGFGGNSLGARKPSELFTQMRK